MATAHRGCPLARLAGEHRPPRLPQAGGPAQAPAGVLTTAVSVTWAAVGRSGTILPAYRCEDEEV